jgi:hypothetical protein
MIQGPQRVDPACFILRISVVAPVDGLGAAAAAHLTTSAIGAELKVFWRMADRMPTWILRGGPVAANQAAAAENVDLAQVRGWAVG